MYLWRRPNIQSHHQQCISPDYCATNPCEHLCVSGTTSYQCLCHPGYNLSSNSTNCLDIDECQSSNAGCSQVYINQPRSYQCYCNSSYSLDSNGYTCSHVQFLESGSSDNESTATIINSVCCVKFNNCLADHIRSSICMALLYIEKRSPSTACYKPTAAH